MEKTVKIFEYTFLILIVILIFSLIAKNPKNKELRNLTYEKVNYEISKNNDNSFENIINNIALYSIKESNEIKYNDYLIFSTLTYNDNLISVGLFNQSFLPKKLIENLKEN